MLKSVNGGWLSDFMAFLFWIWLLLVPVPDDSLRIKYQTFPVKPGQKALIRCQPEQEIFNRFLKVKYWEVFRNDSLIATVTHSSKSFGFNYKNCCEIKTIYYL